MNKLDYNAANLPIPEGEYECFIRDVVKAVSKNGVNHLCARLIIRNDIDQECQNRYIYYNMWKNTITGEYDSRNFNELGKAAKIANGKSYATYQELFADLKLKPVKATVYHDTYNGYTSVKVSRLNETKLKDLNHDMTKIKDKVMGISPYSETPKQKNTDGGGLPF